MKMKKIAALLTISLLAGAAAACGGSGSKEPAPAEDYQVEEEPEETAEEAVTEEVLPEEAEEALTDAPEEEAAIEEEVPERPQASVLFRVSEEEKYYYDFGDTYMLARQEVPFLQILDAPGAEDAAYAIQADLAQKAGQVRAQLAPDFDESMESQDPDYVKETIEDEDLKGTLYEGNIRACRADSAVVSVLLSAYCDNELAAHPTSALAAWNYDPLTGQVLGLADIAKDQNDLIGAVLNEMMEEIGQNEDGRYEGLKGIGPEELSIFVSDGHWYLDTEGFKLVIGEESIAPHAAGSFAFELDYEDLRGILKEMYMPAADGAENEDSSDVSAMVRIDHFEDQAPEGAIAGITLSGDGTSYVLTAVSDLYDFRVCEAVYEDENDFDPDEGGRCFSASRLAQGEYIILTEVVPEGLPATLVCWKDGTGTLYRRTVSMSGQDGSMLLTAAD